MATNLHGKKEQKMSAWKLDGRSYPEDLPSHLCKIALGRTAKQLLVVVSYAVMRAHAFWKRALLLFQSELHYTDIITLKQGNSQEVPEGTQMPTLGKARLPIHIHLSINRSTHPSIQPFNYSLLMVVLSLLCRLWNGVWFSQNPGVHVPCWWVLDRVWRFQGTAASVWNHSFSSPLWEPLISPYVFVSTSLFLRRAWLYFEIRQVFFTLSWPQSNEDERWWPLPHQPLSGPKQNTIVRDVSSEKSIRARGSSNESDTHTL